MSNFINQDWGAIFVQLDGPNSRPDYLGCHDMADITIPKRSVARTWCSDPTKRGEWYVATRTFGPGGEVTFSISVPKGKTADYLEEASAANCPIPVHVHFSECGNRNIFNEYDRGEVLSGAVILQETQSAPATRNVGGTAPGEVLMSFSFSSAYMGKYYSLVATRRAHAAGTALLDVVFRNDVRCAGACGHKREACDVGFCVDTSAVAAVSQPYVSTDGGVTWAATATAPFAVNLNTGGLVYFPITSTIWRLLVARTVTGAGVAQVGYSDDNGATWTLATVGATVTEFVGYQAGVFALDSEHIWLCTDTGAGAAGNIYFSADAGVTWTQLYAGATDALNGIYFADKDLGLCVGDTNEILWTTDGGLHWATIAGPAAMAAVDAKSCVVLDENRWWVAYEGGQLYYTQNGGTTWTARTVPLPTGATAIANIGDIKAVDEHCLWICGQCTIAAGAWGFMARSVDGGYNWESWLPPAVGAAPGLAALSVCGYNQAFAVGCPVAATGLVMEVAET